MCQLYGRACTKTPFEWPLFINDSWVPSSFTLWLPVCTLCLVPSVTMFCFVICQKFQLPVGLRSSCSISPTAGGTCQKCFTKHRYWGDETQCMCVLATRVCAWKRPVQQCVTGKLPRKLPIWMKKYKISIAEAAKEGNGTEWWTVYPFTAKKSLRHVLRGRSSPVSLPGWKWDNTNKGGHSFGEAFYGMQHGWIHVGKSNELCRLFFLLVQISITNRKQLRNTIRGLPYMTSALGGVRK